MRLTALTALAVFFPSVVFAVGDEDPAPPRPTPTTTQCEAGQVYDEETKTCLDAKSDLFDDDARYKAVRELAYDGQYDRALLVLAAMAPDESRVLTYRGFIARKQGDLAAAMTHYEAALRVDADNLLARSYMGQAFVVDGQFDAARQQLREIRQRGGRNSWAEYALRRALEDGRTFSY